MKPRFANARKKLNVKEEAEGLRLTSAAKEGLHQVVPKANSQTKTFKKLKSSRLGGFFLPQI
jgi:hypothetical protein